MASENETEVQTEAVEMEIRGIENLEGGPPVQSQCKRDRLETVFESRFSRYPQPERVPYPGKCPCSNVVIEVIVTKGTEEEIVKGFGTDPVAM
jgi:hypothetical protein